MSWAHEALGIETAADAVEIKRAYARLLKQNRPEDDAAAFQQLHEAFLACLDYRRRRDAGEPVHEWDEDEYEEADEPDVADEGNPGLHADSPVDEDGAPDPEWYAKFEAEMQRAQDLVEFAPRPPPSDDVAALLDELFDVAARDGEAIEPWLTSNELLYGIALKREVAERAVARMVMEQDALSWRAIDAIFRFFEFDSVSDPRFRERPRAKALWQRIHGDERFERHLRRQRQDTYGSTFVDRLVDRELFGAPDRWRRVAMQWFPLLQNSLRQKIELLREVDRERADDSFTPSARAFWLPVFDPHRLHWRRWLPANVQLAVATGLLVLLASLGGKATNAERLGYWGTFFVVCAIVYWAFQLWKFGMFRYGRWLREHYGGGEAPAGSNIFADPSSAFALVVGGLGLALAISLAYWSSGETGAGLALYVMAMTWFGRLRSGSRRRWEELIFLTCATALYWPALGLWPALHPQSDEWELRLVAATSLALYTLVGIDYLHSLSTKLSLPDVRDRVSWPLLAGAALSLGVVFLR